MNYSWKLYRVTYCLIKQAKPGDQSFWRESKKLLNLVTIDEEDGGEEEEEPWSMLPGGHDFIFHARVRMENISCIKNVILDAVCDSRRMSAAKTKLETHKIIDVPQITDEWKKPVGY